MTLQRELLANPFFTFENNIFYQKELSRTTSFETEYIGVRKKENRVYTDEILQNLPSLPDNHLLKEEWLARNASLKKIAAYLKRKNQIKILELGCGNGWLSANLAKHLNAEVCGLDINETELLQGAGVFRDLKNLSLIYSDIFTVDFRTLQFDVILIASSIQYFPDLHSLLNKLLQILAPAGEILILDTPFYNSQYEVDAARKRSHEYFQSLASPDMKTKYFHHTLQGLKHFNHNILYNPSALFTRIKRKLLNKKLPMFPIIQIKHP
jgi:ubiquinone/menaquinone biosynthesis C-methylase UbiE